MKFKVVAFSDTHVKHKKITIPECDLAIFAGDCTSIGYKHEIDSFLTWFGKQDQCIFKIFIAGNHDLCFDPKFEKDLHSSEWLPELLKKHGVNELRVSVQYLNSVQSTSLT